MKLLTLGTPLESIRICASVFMRQEHCIVSCLGLIMSPHTLMICAYVYVCVCDSMTTEQDV